MTNPMMNRSGWLAGVVAAAALALGLACSSGPRGPQLDASGKHPATWLQNHWVAFNQNKNSCTPCHGSYTDPNSTGGTTGINCFTCHVNGNVYAPTHPAGWQTVGNTPFHGAFAKQVPSLTGGFSHCAACHGLAYDNADKTTTACVGCHKDENGVATASPHPAAPWHGTTASGTNHATTDPGNAPECFRCHKDGANLDPANLPLRGTPAPNSAPGCFNNTMCHGDNRSPAHVFGWITAAGHGYNGAMQATPGFASCVACHGAYSLTPTAGSAQVTCVGCHKDSNGAVVQSPHPAAPWDDRTAGSILRHSLVNQSAANIAVCYGCHAGGQNSSLGTHTIPNLQPGCLNNTMCHDNTI